VDGAENNWPSYESMEHYKVAKYFTADEHARVPELQLISLHTWNRLSPEDQEIIRECARASALYERRIWRQWEKKARKTALENGAREILLSEKEKEKFKETVEQVYEKYCADSMDLVEEIRSFVP
ncbi:MAG: TRAP transporter substrate-binding protein DctP, partial [Lachnospiraceae bacterium]|nr:TRAP transporter substrate-binding protein DctP [Lachnospiraceae bacterium]